METLPYFDIKELNRETKSFKPFPDKFLWGSLSATFQAEGVAYEDGKGNSVMDVRV